MGARKYKDGDLIRIPSDCFLVGEVVGYDSKYRRYMARPKYAGIGLSDNTFFSIGGDQEPAFVSKVMPVDPEMIKNGRIIDLHPENGEAALFSTPYFGAGFPNAIGRLARGLLLSSRGIDVGGHIIRYSVSLEMKDVYAFCGNIDSNKQENWVITKAKLYSEQLFRFSPATLKLDEERKFNFVKEWFDNIAAFTVSGTIL